MAAQADGTVLIDTEIKKDGAIEDVNTLKDALQQLTAAVKDLTAGLANSFGGIGKQANSAAKEIDEIGKSAKDAGSDVKSLKEQMDKITVDRGEQKNASGEWQRDTHPRGEFEDLSQEAQKFVDEYATGMDKVEQSTNEFKVEINSLSKQLKDLESQGLYFGDDQYDETYMKLAKVKQALVDYKKEMLNPAESPKINIESLQGQVDLLKTNLRKLSDQGKTFGDELYDSTYTALKKSEAVLKDYQKKLSTPEEIKVMIDDSTLQGKVDSLKQQLTELSKAGATFGDETYDSTYQALGKAQMELNSYKKNLTAPVDIPVELDQDSFAYQIQQLKARLAELGKQGITLGNPDYDSTYAELQRVTQAEKEYKKSLLGTDSAQKQTEKSNKKLNNGLKTTKKNADSVKMSIMGMLGRSLLFSMVFRALSGVSNAIKEGTQNIARYSESTNRALSSLMSSLTMLKNSFAAAFAPVLEYVTPALTRLISKLVDVNNLIAQTMAALAGKDTFTKAVAVQEDYAASLTDTQKAAKEAAKEIKKSAFAFDTLIQVQKSSTDNEYKAPTPDQMFETIAVENEAIALAEEIKNTLSNLFQPLKASWDQYGPSTVNAVKTMFGSLRQLAKDVGASFMQVWKDEGYGKAITDDLIITFGNFALTVANLADQFDKAWVEADTGTSIMRHLGDLVLIVTGFFRQASESIKNWASTLDFGPLLRAFDKVLVSLMPIVSKVGDGLLWLLNNVLLPLAKWALEKALPAALELVAAGLDFLDSTINALKPLALWLWEEFIKPIGQWTGETIIGAIKKLTEKLKEFSDWINNNQEKVRYITELVIAFFLAWKVTEFVTKVKLMMDTLSEAGLMGVLGRLTSKLDVTSLGFFGTAAAVGALALAAYEIYKNWDKMTPTERVIAGVLAAASAFAILAVTMGAIAGPAGAAIRALAITAAIGAALIAINAGARTASSSTSGRYGGGGMSFASTASPYAAYSANIPMLATGTVVPPKAGNFLAMLGDNNKDYEVVSPLETMKQAFKEAIGEMGGIGGGTVQADLIVDGTKFGQLVYKYNNKETDRVGVRLVTTGG